MNRQAKARKKQQTKMSKIQLKAGDLVMLKIPHISKKEKKELHKFWHIFYGPYKIQREVNTNTFELSEFKDNTKIKGIYNRKDLRLYHMRNNLNFGFELAENIRKNT